MKPMRLLWSAIAVLAVSAFGAAAAPMPGPGIKQDVPNTIETVQGNYRACSWYRGGWYWFDHHGHAIACRPHTHHRHHHHSHSYRERYDRDRYDRYHYERRPSHYHHHHHRHW